jgi:hypothetical protein
MSDKPQTKDHLYIVGTTPSLRWAGMKGKLAFVEVATYEQPTITVQGEKRGRIEFPVADIRYLRAGIEYGQKTYYRCVIAREHEPDVVLDGTWSADYPDLVLHIAEEMEALGRFDRVERGVRWWESMIHLVIFGGICAALVYAPYDTYMLYGAGWGRNDFLVWAGLGLAALLGLAFVVELWLRWYRPRRVQDMDDLARILI